MEIMRAHTEWMKRPDDERFLTMADLKAAVVRRRTESWTVAPSQRELHAIAGDGASLSIQTYDSASGRDRLLSPTHWGFGQLATLASAPAGYLRELPPVLAAINLQWGFEHSPAKSPPLLLAQTRNGEDSLRAVTSRGYGRIWDQQVVEAVERANSSGRWVVPSASYTTTNPKRATTLYASDRDVFIFLVDPKNPVEVKGEQLFRGFYVWNSEVGNSVFGLTTFLYRYVCDNRIIWGASQVHELRIRHTSGAPERFANEGGKYLMRYADESTDKLAEGIRRAQDTEIPLNKGKDETVETWLAARGFTKAQAKASVETATAEQGQARSFWDIVNGVTAYARSVQHTDERVQLEAKAGKLMAMVNN